MQHCVLTGKRDTLSPLLEIMTQIIRQNSDHGCVLPNMSNRGLLATRKKKKILILNDPEKEAI